MTPDVQSPEDINAERATRLAKVFMTMTGARGTKPKRVTLSYYLRSLSGLWKHLRELDGARYPKNPWADVSVPKGEKVKKPVPTEARVQAFFAYVQELKTADLSDGGIMFGADSARTKESRRLPLPADSYDRLRAGDDVALGRGVLAGHQDGPQAVQRAAAGIQMADHL